MTDPAREPAELPEAGVLGAWDLGPDLVLTVSPSGLINRTYRVTRGDVAVAVLQRLNTTIFSPTVHDDIEAVTAHLARSGLPTPRLLRTRRGGLWHTDDAGAVWRLLTSVGDRTLESQATVEELRSAGLLVARFHAAVADLDHEFHATRGAFHDTPRRVAELESALVRHRRHRHHGSVSHLFDQIVAALEVSGTARSLPERVVHGDLKLSNVRFTGTIAQALIDLDTLGRGTLEAELGDALRSWCNPAREDEIPSFDLDRFTAAMTGYAHGAELARRAGLGGPSEKEWDALLPGAQRIALELAARFAADALDERYFGWDAARYATRGDHCLARAGGQLALAQAIRQAAGAAADRLAAARSAGARAAEADTVR
jgi:Ser/Thr protein kinase RdoA (MazF antagonist)